MSGSPPGAPPAPADASPSRLRVTALLALMVVLHMELVLPEALRPLSRPEMAELPALLAPLRGIPSPERPFFDKPGPAPMQLVLKALGTALLVVLVVSSLSAGRGARVAASTAALLLVLLLHVVPSLVPIVARLRSGDVALAHDGGTIQIEEAARMLLQGRNPYTESYRGTPLEAWRGLETPIVEHFPYFPWAVLPLVPAVALLQAVGLFDLRLVYLALGLLIPPLMALPERRAAPRLGLALLPFFAPLLGKATILGTNDLYAIFWVALALFLLETGKSRAGMVALGLALAVKQFCWFLVPLLVADAWGRGRRSLHPWLLAAGTFAAVTLPFFLWDPASFLDDTFGYAMGGSATAHPIKGVGSYGFGSLALAYGLVHKATDPSPWTLVGVAGSGVVGLLVVRQLRARPDPATLLAGFAATLLPLLYFARYLHGNFLGYALFFFLWGALREGDAVTADPGLAPPGPRLQEHSVPQND